MVEKPYSPWYEPGAPACQSLCNSPGRPPDAFSKVTPDPSARCTAPITCASDGKAALVDAVTLEASACQAFLPWVALSVHVAGAFQFPSAAPSSASPSAASATSGSARCLPASKGCTLRPMMVLPEFLNSAHEPVVKSCRRVPIASTTSASSASRLAADVPVTPTAAMFSGCVSGSEDLPPCVSQTGMPALSANFASSSEACEYSTPPPAMISGFFAPFSAVTAAANSWRSGRGRRWCQTRSAKKLSG
ncbi:hypothetical protein X753_28655 [Mesorhizobium sp. LNJC399B00]|nr:hypothetical protein X753_28655 [Mesorhizobium sp. LNJC399B00]